MNHGVLLELIQQLYAAPGTATGWPTFLETLRVSTSASSANLIAHSPEARSSDITAAAGNGADPEGGRQYEQHWCAHDPWAYSPRLSRRAGSVFLGDVLIPHAELQRTGFYADFGRRFDVVRVVGATIEAGATGMSVISVNGSERREPFSETEAKLLEMLMPHMQQALRLHRRLLQAEQASGDLAAIIERSNRAVILIDRRGTIAFINGAASRLAAQQDGFSIERSGLRAANTATTARLRTLIGDAIRTSVAEGIGGGGIVALGRPSGRRPLIALVCAVARRTLAMAENAAAAVVSITDPEVTAVPDDVTLSQTFGLTPAEARHTRLLAEGTSLAEAAARLGLRRETARTRIKIIFEKTGTHRQAELVSLVMRAVPHE